MKLVPNADNQAISAHQMITSVIHLVTLPDIYFKVKRIIEDPNSSAMDLARVIAIDPALTVRILRLVNSAFWGFTGRIESVSRAVTLLGTLQVHDMALACSVASAFDGISPQQMDVRKFWRGSVFRGLAATTLARTGGLVDVGRVFTIGLLSDIGHMLMYHNAPELAASALAHSHDQPWELARLERESIGCDYAQVGSALADAWGLPECFGAALRQQLNPTFDGNHALESALLHIAAMLAHAREFSHAEADCIAHIVPDAWQLLDLSAGCIPEVLSEVDGSLSATEQLFQ